MTKPLPNGTVVLYHGFIADLKGQQMKITSSRGYGYYYRYSLQDPKRGDFLASVSPKHFTVLTAPAQKRRRPKHTTLSQAKSKRGYSRAAERFTVTFSHHDVGERHLTVATVKDAYGVTGEGVSVKHPDDKHMPGIGEELAKARALKALSKHVERKAREFVR